MANGIVQFLIVTCGIFFFAENVTSSPRPIPEADTEVDPAASIDADCEDDELTCDNKNCVDKILECDGEDDCMDGTDENNCPAPAVPESLPETDASQEDTTPPVATITETTEKAVKLGELATCGMVLGGAALECDEGLECKFDDDCFYCTMGTCQKVVADEANAVETVGTATETAVPATMDDETFSDIPPQPEAVTIVS